MKRNTLIKIHLYLSAFFAPVILLMAVSGTSYLLGFKGHSTIEELHSIESVELINDEFVKNELSKINPGYHYEYLKESGNKTFTRPTTREYYQFTKIDGNIKIEKISPNFLAKIIEAHKGHGPGYFKTIQKIFGICLILILFSGIWLALTVKRDVKITLVLVGIGSIVTLALAFLL